jgi:hypothetical protein
MRRLSKFAFVGIAITYMLLVDMHATSNDGHFAGNFAVWWMPQVLVLCVALLLRPPVELLGGIAAAYGTFVGLCWLWGGLTLGWAGYLLCVFGASTGAVSAGFKSMMREGRGGPIAALEGFLFVAIGIAINGLILRLLFR